MGATDVKRAWRSGLVTCVVLCVPKTPSTSCDQAIFVDHGAGESPSSDAVLLYFDWFG